ncbi:glycosyltransferase family 2 protein [bacterium]|nr:glycosyltransferase family 2 protein [bacterium]
MKPRPYVVVVILTWNNRDIVLESIHSVRALDYAPFDIVVVDNGSSDGTAEAVARQYPDVTIVRNGKNYGAIKGKNYGLARALAMGAEYLFVLDDDLTADPDALRHMVTLCESDPEIGMTGAKIYDFEQRDLILSCGSKIDFTQNIVRQYGRGEREQGRYTVSMDVDFLGMGHTLIKREVLEDIGLLDESFIGYGYEDVDYGVMVRKSGRRVVFCPDAVVWHRPHSGVGTYTFKKKYLEARNAIVFMRKHARWYQWLKYVFFLSAGMIYAMVVEGAKGNIRGVWGKILGVLHGLAGKESLARELLYN